MRIVQNTMKKSVKCCKNEVFYLNQQEKKRLTKKIYFKHFLSNLDDFLQIYFNR
jgi:hypothetical protein